MLQLPAVCEPLDRRPSRHPPSHWRGSHRRRVGQLDVCLARGQRPRAEDAPPGSEQAAHCQPGATTRLDTAEELAAHAQDTDTRGGSH